MRPLRCYTAYESFTFTVVDEIGNSPGVHAVATRRSRADRGRRYRPSVNSNSTRCKISMEWQTGASALWRYEPHCRPEFSRRARQAGFFASEIFWMRLKWRLCWDSRWAGVVCTFSRFSCSSGGTAWRCRVVDDELFEGRNVSGKRREQNSISISLSLSLFLFGYNSTIPWRFARSASKLLTTTTPRTCKGSNAATGFTRRASPVGREAPTKTNLNHHAVLVVARGRRLLQH